MSGVVDDESASRAACFCLMRSKREDFRASGVSFAFATTVRAGVMLFSLSEEEEEGADGSEGKVVVVVEGLERAWALMAPALRSSSLRWPFARRGARTVADVQGVIGRRGREVMKVSTGEPEAGFEVVLNVFHWLRRFVAKVALNISSFKSRFCGESNCSERVAISTQIFECP